mgnify:CR=1 FL=1
MPTPKIHGRTLEDWSLVDLSVAKNYGVLRPCDKRRIIVSRDDMLQAFLTMHEDPTLRGSILYESMRRELFIDPEEGQE